MISAAAASRAAREAVQWKVHIHRYQILEGTQLQIDVRDVDDHIRITPRNGRILCRCCRRPPSISVLCTLGDLYQVVPRDIVHLLPGPPEPVVVKTPDEFVQSLPRLKFDPKTELNHTRCGISQTDFSAGDIVIQLPCSHTFLEDAIIPWLQRAHTCPVCRYELPGETVAPNEARPVEHVVVQQRIVSTSTPEPTAAPLASPVSSLPSPPVSVLASPVSVLPSSVESTQAERSEPMLLNGPSTAELQRRASSQQPTPAPTLAPTPAATATEEESQQQMRHNSALSFASSLESNDPSTDPVTSALVCGVAWDELGELKSKARRS